LGDRAKYESGSACRICAQIQKLAAFAKNRCPIRRTEVVFAGTPVESFSLRETRHDVLLK
jgi:hypothetical protein